MITAMEFASNAVGVALHLSLAVVVIFCAYKFITNIDKLFIFKDGK